MTFLVCHARENIVLVMFVLFKCLQSIKLCFIVYKCGNTYSMVQQPLQRFDLPLMRGSLPN